MNKQRTSFGKKLSNLEKEWFPWQTGSLVPGQPAFFPGCNLVNFLPETAKKTAQIFKELNGGWLYDCCGKPLQLAGDKAAAARVTDRINSRLKTAGVTELIVACPNCLFVFKRSLEIPVRDIYTFLKERGVPCALKEKTIQTFPPCPDRGSGEIRSAISKWTGKEIREASGLPCCGLGIADPHKARNALDKIRTDGQGLSPYCASCYGHLTRHGVQMTPHILTEGLGIKERVSQGLRKSFNRMKPWFWK